MRGRTGWIAIDPLTPAETARAAVRLFQEHVGQGPPITAVIQSYSHGDHWGGVRGVVDEADLRAGKVEIVAPRDFMQHTISDYVYAGNAMNRRLFYQCGVLLPASLYGHAGQGLGMTIAAGRSGLIAPTRIIENDIEEFEVDGVNDVASAVTPRISGGGFPVCPGAGFTWRDNGNETRTARDVVRRMHDVGCRVGQRPRAEHPGRHR